MLRPSKRLTNSLSIAVRRLKNSNPSISEGSVSKEEDSSQSDSRLKEESKESDLDLL